MPAMSESEARGRLGEVPGWDVGEKSLVRKLSLPSFPEAIAFVVKVAFVAEAADHHPDVHGRRVARPRGWVHRTGWHRDAADERRRAPDPARSLRDPG